MASNYLLDSDHVVRFVPWGKLRRDEDDNVVGVLPEAFALRADEEYLSVTWCDYFNGSHLENIRCAIEAIRNSDLTVGSKAQFAVGQVANIRSLVEDYYPKKLRIIHEPEEDNDAHVSIRHWPRDDLRMLALLAEDPWKTLFDAQTANALPTSPCAKSNRVI
jgi:hypothetical protein